MSDFPAGGSPLSDAAPSAAPSATPSAAPSATPSAASSAAVTAAAASGDPLTVLIDGPSGAGKTTWAASLGYPVVHLDDFYPGWSGLAAAAQMVARDVLDPVNPGFWRWDWDADRRGAWQPLPRRGPGEVLVVEGAGAVTAESVAAARALGRVHTVLVTAPEEVRRTRALARDPYYAPFWAMWARQEERHFSVPVHYDEVIRG
ncbi:hypothetical protein [Corynebacterium uberis]|uniref:hypothetical protein n=1 Tax=Corynebacterium uberis TaxID=2883169 RepID=UPI0024B09A2D|nr:hypothetical protein [Corynebacterium uberis]